MVAVGAANGYRAPEFCASVARRSVRSVRLGEQICQSHHRLGLTLPVSGVPCVCESRRHCLGT